MSGQTLRTCLVVMTVTLLASTAGAIERVSKRHERPQPPDYYPRPGAAATTPVPERLGVFEVYGAFSSPTGSIDHLGDIKFPTFYRPLSLSAKDVYSQSITLGVSLGTLRMGHWYNSVGFEYSHLRVKDTIYFPRGGEAIVFNYPDYPKPHFNQYEVRLNSNYQFYDVGAVGWTPYVGLGLGVGLISETFEGYRTQTELNVGLAMNFGAEVVIWQAPGRGNMVTLASANRWEFAGSGYRPKFLSLGVALKVYSSM